MQQVSTNGSLASLTLSQSGRGNRRMNSKRSLMTALVGLAMLATPIAAAAHDNHFDHATHAARVAAAVNGTHPFANHAFGNGAFARHERHEERAIADANAYRNYGYAAPVYAA